MATDDTKDTEKKASDKEYNFGIGHPHKSLNLPKKLISKCISEHLTDENDKYYNESTDYGLCEGSWYFRSELADWLNNLDKDNKYENIYGTNIVLTTGASQSMELLLIHLKKLKGNKDANIVLCEDPSYYLFPDIVSSIPDYKLLTIPFIDNYKSLDFEYLENIFIKYNQKIIAFYIIPTHQNPLGISYDIKNKIKLINLCQKYKIHLIADEVYNLLSFDKNTKIIPFIAQIEQTLFSAKDNDDEEDVNYFCHSISSFSKIIGPGFRIGWIYSGNDKLLKSISNHGSIKSGGSMTQFIPEIIRYLFKNNDMTNHVNMVRNELGKNCKILCETLKEYDKDNLISFNEPNGGYFIWLKLPINKIKKLESKELNVKYFNGMDLSSTFGPIAKDIQFVNNDDDDINNDKDERKKYFEQCIRFCFAYLTKEEIRQGVIEFVKAVYQND